MAARYNEQSLLFELYKAFDHIESSKKFGFFLRKGPIFLNTCVTCSDLSSNISTMVIPKFSYSN